MLLSLTEEDSFAPISEICKRKVASSHMVFVTNFIKIWFKCYGDGGTNRNDKTQACIPNGKKKNPSMVFTVKGMEKLGSFFYTDVYPMYSK
jgi:hypothetical protein